MFSTILLGNLTILPVFHTCILILCSPKVQISKKINFGGKNNFWKKQTLSGHPLGYNWPLCKIWYAYLLYLLSLVLPKFLVLTVLYSKGFENLNFLKKPNLEKLVRICFFWKYFEHLMILIREIYVFYDFIGKFDDFCLFFILVF